MVVPVIEVSDLSKRYYLGQTGAWGGYKRFSESLVNLVTHPIRTSREGRKEKDSFWALQDVSFNVSEGEVIGVIGRNGAGKSTLLKILSQITYPTRGKVILRGRVGSLLEVGTGFHPELTGSENIYMSGAILGMHRAEIKRKFDDIVQFAEVEKFLDTPVKRYSSGMYVRLAFAVAAHLEPEILLIDEVLAVGDAQFQKKCLGKIKDVSQGGRTVLFVSHNMAAVEGICSRGLFIDKGTLKKEGPTSQVVAEYLRLLSVTRQNNLEDTVIRRKGNGKARFTWIEILDEEGNFTESIPEKKPFKVSLAINAKESIDIHSIIITFTDSIGRPILTTMSYDSLDIKHLDPGTHRYQIRVDPNPFLRGGVSLKLGCYGPHFVEYDVVDDAYAFNITPDLESKDTFQWRPGVVNITLKWTAPLNCKGK